MDRAQIGATVRARLLATAKVLKVPTPRLDIFVVRDFLAPKACAALIKRIDKGCAPSGMLGPHPDPEFRTSQTCNLDPVDPAVVAVENQISALTGIDPEHGETLQGQRYDVGQQFKQHHDYFYTDQPYWPDQERSGGQRTWTVMAFLDAPQARRPYLLRACRRADRAARGQSAHLEQSRRVWRAQRLFVPPGSAGRSRRQTYRHQMVSRAALAAALNRRCARAIASCPPRLTVLHESHTLFGENQMNQMLRLLAASSLIALSACATVDAAPVETGRRRCQPPPPISDAKQQLDTLFNDERRGQSAPQSDLRSVPRRPALRRSARRLYHATLISTPSAPPASRIWPRSRRSTAPRSRRPTSSPTTCSSGRGSWACARSRPRCWR